MTGLGDPAKPVEEGTQASVTCTMSPFVTEPEVTLAVKVNGSVVKSTVGVGEIQHDLGIVSTAENGSLVECTLENSLGRTTATRELQVIREEHRMKHKPGPYSI